METTVPAWEYSDAELARLRDPEESPEARKLREEAELWDFFRWQERDQESESR